VENHAVPEVNNLTKTLFGLSKLYGKIAEIPSATNRKKLLLKRKTLLRDSFTSLMKEADNIDDPELRNSFLNIRLHRQITEQYNHEVSH